MLGASYHLVSKSSALAPGTSSSAWVCRVSPFRLVRVVRLCPCCARRVSAIFNWSVRIEPPLSLWSFRRFVLCFGCFASVAYGRVRVPVCAWWSSSRMCDRSRPTSPARVPSRRVVSRFHRVRRPDPYVVSLARCPQLSPLPVPRSVRPFIVASLASLASVYLQLSLPSALVLSVIPCRRWCARRPVVALVRSALRDRSNAS